jgi:CRP-like cAMP-binding protein
MRRAGRRIVHCDPKDALFSQGDSANSVFYLQSGRLKVTVVSENGKEATITMLSAGDFIGEDSLAGTAGPEREKDREAPRRLCPAPLE